MTALIDCRDNEATKEELLSMLRASLIRKESSRSKKRSYETTKNERPISTSDNAPHGCGAQRSVASRVIRVACGCGWLDGRASVLGRDYEGSAIR